MIVKINNLDHEGRGITRVNNKVTFVKNALPNEIVNINITKEKKNYNESELISIIEKSKDRRTPKCPYYNECGGCDLMHMDYESQINFKKEKVINILKKYTQIDINPESVKSDKEFNYRNKITLHNLNNKIGFKKKKTNNIIEIKNCPIAMNSINEYIESIDIFKDPELIIRTNENGKIISSINDKPLIMEINDLKFYIDINSFFQVNNYICSQIFDFIIDNIDIEDTCLDLYSGVGTLSILASKKAKYVYSIELNEYSHKNALKNLKLNNINNVNFILGSVEDKIKDIDKNVDVIITDPPRAGMDKITLNVIKEIKPKKIIYVSCDPMTLARDINILKESYEIKESKIFDMFPNTKHVECVFVLNRRVNPNK